VEGVAGWAVMIARRFYVSIRAGATLGGGLASG
jgi:hypothetical protein